MPHHMVLGLHLDCGGPLIINEAADPQWALHGIAEREHIAWRKYENIHVGDEFIIEHPELVWCQTCNDHSTWTNVTALILGDDDVGDERLTFEWFKTEAWSYDED